MIEFKKQKRSKKFDCCVVCGSTKRKHKWRWIWLCCWDKERLKNPKRAINKKFVNIRYNFRFRVKFWLSKKDFKRKSIFWENKEKREKESKRFWYLCKRWEKMKKSWENILQIIKNWKIIYLPILAWEFEKPKLLTSKDYKNLDKEKVKEYEKKLKKYKKDLEIFDFCRNFKTLEEIKNKI